MPRFITRLAPLHGTQSLRVTVTWRRARIRRVSFRVCDAELVPPLARRPKKVGKASSPGATAARVLDAGPAARIGPSTRLPCIPESRLPRRPPAPAAKTGRLGALIARAIAFLFPPARALPALRQLPHCGRESSRLDGGWVRARIGAGPSDPEAYVRDARVARRVGFDLIEGVIGGHNRRGPAGAT